MTRTIAFYLPQFHPIPENDEWWGVGFTEWTNVSNARPQFIAHNHPRTPANLGYYQLPEQGIMERQSELASENGVDAFCFYHYWFDGRRLLERPVDYYRDSRGNIPFCLAWANEPWSRRWDGKQHDILMPQTYGEGWHKQFFEDTLPYFQSPHYLRHRNKPILLVHRAYDLPDPNAVTREWRRLAVSSGFEGLYLIAAETRWGLDPRLLGFDAAAEFPPVGANSLRSARLRAPAGLLPEFRGRLFDYNKLADRFACRRESVFVRHRGVAPGWDNTARRGSSATIYMNSTPEEYQRWLSQAIAAESAARGEDGLVFINAWNEWAEGAYLEPDNSHRDLYLRATKAAVRESKALDGRVLRTNYGHLQGVAKSAAASAVNLLHFIRRIFGSTK
ncbi:glycoside hydrolase family 99-like domain-containing protein [Nocardioides sp. NPDC092400]|uniref:glycosyltransferase WbsX family protein n=1 Tax=Nocardioides sp. NPDC092400 TaxID=3155196 RepID=UPI00344483A7